jgi:hypothetical protein
MHMGPRPIKIWYWSVWRGHSFSLGFHSMVFQAKIYAIKACVMDSIEKDYTGRDIYILSVHQVAIKTVNSFHISSKSVTYLDYKKR